MVIIFFNKAHFLPLSLGPHNMPMKQIGPIHVIGADISAQRGERSHS